MRDIQIAEYPEADRAPGCHHPRETYDLIGHGEAEARFLTAKSSGRHGNLFVLRRPYNEKTKKLRSEIPVDAVRDMSSFFKNTPAEDSQPRIALIDTMDEMNRSAENAILKTLEEPPENALIILLANSPGRLLPTIRSRCLSLPLRPISASEIKPWLEAKVKEQPQIIEAAIGLSRGGPGKCAQAANTVSFELGA